MTTGFQQQQQQVNFSFPKAAPQPQVIGQKLEPTKQAPKSPAERRSFR
jgi:hypothetical protein